MTTLVDRDAVRVARVELADVDSPNELVRRAAVATLAQAVHEMGLADPEAFHTCARLTHSDGNLIARYRSAGSGTAGGAS